MIKNPDVLVRKSDGEKFISNGGYYSMEKVVPNPPYRWSYELLMKSHGFRRMTEDERKTGIIVV